MAKKKNNKDEQGVVPPVDESVVETVPENSPDLDEDSADDAVASQTDATANEQLRTMMDRNFLEYASYVLKDRVLPDVDDGFKPVQRRILWTMFQEDDGTFHKVNGVVGNTMKIHPHGDASIYGALVYLANKELFIDKQGNYGSIVTGMPAAAGRYIECRLSKLAKDVLFSKAITQTIESYDGRTVEPVALPAKIPTLLIMGVEGIAVGTNTKVMPHNFTEVLQAQIAYLRGEPFTLYPDFFQGGIMDVSKYEDGKGRISIRAKLDIEGKDVIVREIPYGTTTVSLMDSVTKAIQKNKIKFSTCHDYTAANVDIHLVSARGYSAEKSLDALYAYTDCQYSISCNPMVLVDNRPCCLTVTEILKHNTDRLVQYLTWELLIEAGENLNKILARTLVQIFIQEGIYKRIEKCKSKQSMFEVIRTGLEEFKDEWLPVVQQLHENLQKQPHIVPMSPDEVKRLEQLSNGVVPDSEIEYLVEIPIRRISAFENDENRLQIDQLNKNLDKIAKNLTHIKTYTIKFIQGIIDKYGALFPRRTEIVMDGFEKIDMHKVALSNIRVGWDKKNSYIGSEIKSDDTVMCSEVDHLLCVQRTGEYKVINIPDKMYIDRLYEFRKYDKNTEFGIVYSEKKTGRIFIKRTSIGQFITDKDYRIIPEDCRLEVITPRPNAIYEVQIDTPIKSRQNAQLNLMDAPVRSPKAGGKLFSPRKILKITFVRYLDENEETPPAEPVLPDILPPPDPDQQPPADSGTNVVSDTPVPEKKEPMKRPKDDGPSEDDNNWGIQQDLGF